MMRRRTRALASFALLLAAAAAPSVARADDTSELEGLLSETVETTASKSAETSTASPATSTIVTAEDLRAYGIHTLDEAIDFLSLGMVSGDPLRDVEMGSRGVLLTGDWGSHVLLLVNGHAMNEPSRGSAFFGRGAGVPIEAIDHIEVVLGPGSVLYGSNAMLGVINVITKRAKDFSGWNVVGESEIGKSWRVGTGLGTELRLFGKPSELTLQVEYFAQDGPTLHLGPQVLGNDQFLGVPEPKAAWGIGDGTWGGDVRHAHYTRAPSGVLRFKSGELEVNLLASSYERGMPYLSAGWSTFVDFDSRNSYYRDRALRGDVRYRFALSPIVTYVPRVYVDSTDRHSQFEDSLASGCLYVGAGPTCLYSNEYAARWIGLENQVTFDWKKDNTFVTLVGADARGSFVGTKADVRDAGNMRYLASSAGVFSRYDALLGAYAQQTWSPVSTFGVNAGARFDAGNRYPSAFSPRLAVREDPWPGGTLKAIYSEAFRSPTPLETDAPGEASIANHDLKPERVRSVEGVVEQRFGSQRLTFGVFRSWWTDMINVHILSAAEQQQLQQTQDVSTRATNIMQFRNVSSIDDYGFNGGFEGSVGTERLRYGLNVTGAIARQQSDGSASLPMTVAPQLYGNARLAYALPDGWPTLAVAAHGMSKRLMDRAIEGGFNPYPYAPPQLELRGTVSGGVPHVKGLSYRASVNWAAADRGPYAVGPIQSFDTYHQPPELVPVDTLRFTVGLEYRLGD